MRTIYKYAIGNPGGFSRIRMPKNAKILSVGVQRNTPCIWAEVDTDQPTMERVFAVFPTGGVIGPDLKVQYVGRLDFDDMMYIFHVYEIV